MVPLSRETSGKERSVKMYSEQFLSVKKSQGGNGRLKRISRKELLEKGK